MIFSVTDTLKMSLDEICKLFSVSELGLVEQIEEETYAEFKETGFSVVMVEKILSTIFLYSEGYEGYRQFKHQICSDVSFDTPRGKIREKYGAPSNSNETPGKSSFGDIPMWDMYDFDEYSLHFQYGMVNDSKIELISLQRK